MYYVYVLRRVPGGSYQRMSSPTVIASSLSVALETSPKRYTLLLVGEGITKMYSTKLKRWIVKR